MYLQIIILTQAGRFFLWTSLVSFLLGIFPKILLNLRISFTKNNLTRLFLEGWIVICFLKLNAKDLTITHHMKEPGFFNSTSKFLCLVTMTCVKAFSGEENSSLKIYFRPIQCYFMILTIRVYFPIISYSNFRKGVE